ncbi:hypothetical protein ACVWY3_006084 [Bradyrhizobium sp. USDA 4486]
MMRWLSEWWRGGTAAVEPASARDAARLAQLHGASFARGWGESEFESMLIERNTLVHRLRLGRKTIGFAVSRIGADEAEILSIAVDQAHRGPRPLPDTADDPSRPPCRARCAHNISRSRRK